MGSSVEGPALETSDGRVRSGDSHSSSPVSRRLRCVLFTSNPLPQEEGPCVKKIGLNRSSFSRQKGSKT